MIGLPLLVAALLAPSAADYVESRLSPNAEILRYETPDVNDDRLGDVVLITRDQDRRVLHVYLQSPGGSFGDTPDWRLTLPADVVSYTFLDVRDEPGRELLLLTSTGVFSVSTTRPELRKNLRRELETPLFPELSEPDDVSRWDWARDLDGDDRPELLLLTDGALVGFSIPEDGGEWQACATLPCAVLGEKEENERRVMGGRISFQMERWVNDLFPGLPSSRPMFRQENLLNRSLEWQLPALVDWNGDGQLDAALRSDRGFRVVLQGAAGEFSAEADRRIMIPDGFEVDDAPRLLDMDGDGSVEVVLTGSGDGALSRDYTVTVIPRLADGSLAEEAVARVKLNASHVRFRFEDIDRDGHIDLVAWVLELPSGIQTLTSTRIDLSLMVFLGGEGGTLTRRPVARYEKRMRPEQVERVRESFLMEMTGDYDGDGLNDLLVMRDDGLLLVYRFEKNGSDYSFADRPISVYKPAEPVRGAWPAELTRDGISDLVLRHERALTVFVSRTAGTGEEESR